MIKMINKYSPIVVFAYNRAENVKNLLNSLMTNDISKESDLFIFIDGPKNNSDVLKVNEVINTCNNKQYQENFNSVSIEQSDTNKGLANSIISGVSKVINIYGKVVVLEDDLIVAPYFLKFMNLALDKYETNNKIWSISGFSRNIDYLEKNRFDIYYSVRAQSWSWATWKDRWNSIDWEVNSYDSFKYNFVKRREFNFGGNDMSSLLDRQQCGYINSWAIRFCYEQFLHNAYTIQPRLTLIQNFGQNGSGTNCNYVREMSSISHQDNWNFKEFNEDKEINEELKKTRKRIPYIKLVGSFIVFVVFKGKLIPKKK